MFNADKIRELRLKGNLTTAELGSKIEVSQVAITKWENGDAIPNANALERLADLFGVPLDVFFVKNTTPQSQSAVGE